MESQQSDFLFLAQRFIGIRYVFLTVNRIIISFQRRPNGNSKFHASYRYLNTIFGLCRSFIFAIALTFSYSMRKTLYEYRDRRLMILEIFIRKFSLLIIEKNTPNLFIGYLDICDICVDFGVKSTGHNIYCFHKRENLIRIIR